MVWIGGNEIAVKIMRALIGDEFDAEETPLGYNEDQAQDNAKVELVGIERSIGAWARLREPVLETADCILPILLHLEQLLRATEHAFPKAQSFVRPGFDEAPDRSSVRGSINANANQSAQNRLSKLEHYELDKLLLEGSCRGSFWLRS